MHDTCKIGVASTSTDGPYTVQSYTWGSEIACGFNPNPGGESADGAESGVNVAEIRLPHGTTVTSTSRVRITHRSGAAVTEQDWAVDGDPHVGPTGIVVALKAIHGGRRA